MRTCGHSYSVLKNTVDLVEERWPPTYFEVVVQHSMLFNRSDTRFSYGIRASISPVLTESIV